MKAVNLIPSAEGRSAASGGAPSAIVLGVLALLVVLVAAFTLTGKTVADKKAELANVTQQAEDVEARNGDLSSFTKFAADRKARVETVKGLVDSRIDWAHAMHEVARTIPSGTWITSLRATATPTVSVEGTSDTLRSAIASPALEVTGCAPNQERVADVMAAFRQITHVERVTLSASEKQDAASTEEEGCGTRPQFSMSIFLAPSQSTTATSGGTTP